MWQNRIGGTRVEKWAGDYSSPLARPVLIAALVGVTALAAVDEAGGRRLVLIGLLAVGPALAALATSPRVVVLVGAYAGLLGAVLSQWPDRIWGSRQQAEDLVVLVGITVASAVGAHWRRRMELIAAATTADQRALAAIVDSSDDAIISVTLDGTIRSWNRGAQNLYGYPPADVIGQNIALVYPPDRQSERVSILTRIGQGERVEHYVTQRVAKNGAMLDVSITVSPILDAAGTVIGASKIARDVSGQLQAEADHRVLTAIIESSNDAIIAHTVDGTITAWNAAAQRIYGYPPEDAIGRNIALIYPPHLLDESADVLSRVAQGESVELHDTPRRRKDGTLIDVSVTISPIHDNVGSVTGASVIAHDITARKQAQAREREHDERSKHAQHLQSLGQLAGGIAHDFNNLLAIITNHVDFIDEQLPAGHQTHSDLDKIRQAAERATALSRQLLVFARGEPVPAEVFDLNTAIADAQSLLTRTLGAHVHLVTVPAPAPVLIDADRGQIQQVLLNLALNARDAMPEGGTLVIEATVTDVDADTPHLQHELPPGRYARLLISDTGTGMSPETVAHIFEPFYSTKPKGHGTGLGLATVYGIVTRSGGGIHVYSELNLGTTIRIYLPLAQRGSDTETPSATPPPGGQGETILVVDDEEAIRQIVERILTRNGYRVLIAASGSEALSLINNRCDLLLTDVVMPGMSGRRLAELAHQQWPDLPTLYMSGYSDGLLTTQRLLDQGTELIQKPFTAPDLLRKIAAILGRTRTVGLTRPNPSTRTTPDDIP